MKSKTLMAMAIAGTFACAGAFAGGGHHGAHMSSPHMSSHSSYEVQTPASVNESAPWLASQGTLHGRESPDTTIGFQEGQFSDGPVGTSSSTGGTGSGGFDSSRSMPDELSMGTMHGLDNGESVTVVEYWLLGQETTGTGMSSSAGGSGSGGFDSTMSASTDMTSTSDTDSAWSIVSWGDPLSYVSTSSAEDVIGMVGGEETPLLSEHYLVYGPISSFDGQNVIVLELGPASEDVALLDSLSRDFYVLTPVYDEG